jgi:hypothetical protein
MEEPSQIRVCPRCTNATLAEIDDLDKNEKNPIGRLTNLADEGTLYVYVLLRVANIRDIS